MLGQKSNKDNRSTGTAGIQYLLPMNILFEARGDLDGKAEDSVEEIKNLFSYDMDET